MSKFRFHISDNDGLLETTGWLDEIGPQYAAGVAGQLRLKHGIGARIRVERDVMGGPRKQNFVRFKIALPRDETRYSKAFPASERDTAIAKFREEYPKATITEETWNV